MAATDAGLLSGSSRLMKLYISKPRCSESKTRRVYSGISMSTLPVVECDSMYSCASFICEERSLLEDEQQRISEG